MGCNRQAGQVVVYSGLRDAEGGDDVGQRNEVIGVDLGGTQIRAARMADGATAFASRVGTLTEGDDGPEAVLDRIADTARQAANGDFATIRAIGIGAPGPLDPKKGILYEAPNLPGWINIPLQHELEKRLGIPVLIGNDANLAGLGEYRYGAGRGVDDMIYITISTGIGGGIITNGEMLVGAHGLGAEVGHMVVDPKGPVCNCGGVGHVEALAAGPAIARTARARLSAEQPSMLRQLVKGDVAAVTAAHVSEAAQMGDPLARAVLREAGYYIGLAFINLVHIFNPSLFVIGGGVSNAGDLILDPIRETLRAGVMSPAFLDDLRIERAALGGDVGLWGAVALAQTTKP